MSEMHSDSTQSEQWRRLQWQCRRGIKEVEVLLVPFFETEYAGLSEGDKVRFVQLLDQQDADLFEWFTSRCQPDDPDLQYMVNRVLHRVGT